MNNIFWDVEKEQKLLNERGISFCDVAEMIKDGNYIDMLKNPAREGQRIFLMMLNNYVHVVPFVTDEDGNIVLKTVFPSRKYQKIYTEG